MVAEPWFDPNTFGMLVDAIGGGVGGTLGGLIGAAAGVLAPRGKARFAVLGSMWLMALVGLATLATGIVAVTQQQPYAIWYPLVLLGGIFTLVMGTLIPVVRKRYTEAEHKRMAAVELRGQY